MRRLFAVSLLSFALAPLCHAIDLAQAYDLALKNDADWAAVTSAFKAESIKEGQNYGALLPTIGMSASFAQNDFSPDIGAGAQLHQHYLRAPTETTALPRRSVARLSARQGIHLGQRSQLPPEGAGAGASRQ